MSSLPPELQAYLEARGHRSWRVLGPTPEGDGWVLEIQGENGVQKKGVIRGGGESPVSLHLLASYRAFP